ncbi:DUF1778 domain-containing protein [Desulfovibrio oxamicus]|uniref:DUF1778 domain-containing protein n=1 Tax=Nitratidesulfovibrio oxamicus TaxID=32016 RepID=A0ABS0J3C3_9BACT|nr:DUF1778 domain-containing protein [Nitratidesulfovibrio oxamicus]MBG3876208.1 DUF1778 domain-containing protein [Nitratidesulfovibrio oxamicus]
MASTDIINLRVPPEQKAIIDLAAALAGKNRTAFILEHAVRSAEELLLEKSHFQLSTAQWDAFQAALDAPVRDNPALEHLLATPAPWDDGE